jgi:SAM-dependent methyltransferase
VSGTARRGRFLFDGAGHYDPPPWPAARLSSGHGKGGQRPLCVNGAPAIQPAVTAVDLSREMLAVLSSKLAALGGPGRCEIRNSSIDDYLMSDPDRRFDIISMSSVAHHLPDYLETLDRLAQRINPGGYLYLVHEPCHRSEMVGDPAGLRRLWSVLPRGLDRTLKTFKVDPSLHREWESHDTRFADYHYHRDGISTAAISGRLSRHGFNLTSVTRYNAHQTSFVSWLDNYWCAALRYEQFQRTYFRAVWQRR